VAFKAKRRGIGVDGNRNVVAPDIEAVEFGTAVTGLVRPGNKLIEIIEGEELIYPAPGISIDWLRRVR